MCCAVHPARSLQAVHSCYFFPQHLTSSLLACTGPSRSRNEAPPNMQDDVVRLCAYAQHIPADVVLSRFIEQVDCGRGLELRARRQRATTAAEQQTAAEPVRQQRDTAGAAGGQPTSVVVPVSDGPPMLGDCRDVSDWLQRQVFTSLEGVDYLTPLHHLLWRHVTRFTGLVRQGHSRHTAASATCLGSRVAAEQRPIWFAH